MKKPVYATEIPQLILIGKFDIEVIKSCVSKAQIADPYERASELSRRSSARYVSEVIISCLVHVFKIGSLYTIR